MKPKSQVYELDAFMVPGHWFFCRRIEIPADLEKGEEEGFALLELESLSPFPLEHLNYGYRLDEAGRFAFVFAAYKRRFERVDQSHWRRIDAVLPDFLLGLHNDAKADSGLVLVTEKSFIAFLYDDVSSLPSGFYAEARVFAEGEDEAPSLQAQTDGFVANAKARLGFNKSRTWFANTSAKWVGQVAWLGAVDSSESPAAKVSFTRDQIWKADLRDPEMVDQAKKDERQNRVLWKVLGGIAALFGLLLLGELYWAGSSAYLSYRENAIAERLPKVLEIEDLQKTSVALRDFQESNLRPFAMIDELWPLQQYPDILYRKFDTEGPEVLKIEARAANKSQVTEFKKRLERSPKVSSVDISAESSNATGTTFTTTIRFKFGAFYEVAGVGKNG